VTIEYVRHLIADPERRAAFESAYASAARHLDAAPECLDYDLAHGVEEPERCVLRIAWTSVEDHEQASAAAPTSPRSSPPSARTSVTSRR
jgi:quinol monooxygenase YgiN